MNLDLGTHLIFGSAGAELDLRHRGNRGQRLATETEGVERIDILGGANLRGGVAIEGHTGIDDRHTTTVVDHLNQLAATIAEIDHHATGAGIDGILHHLLNHRCGAVDHLTCGNLVGYHFGQQTNLIGHLVSVLCAVRVKIGIRTSYSW